VQGQPDAVYVKRHAVGQFLDGYSGTQAGFEQNSALGGRKIATAAMPRMVGMGMGDDRPIYGFPGVDVEIAGPAAQTGFSVFDHGGSACGKLKIDNDASS